MIKMSIKLSHSSQNLYLSCGERYRLHYIEKWRPITLSSPLVFGSAIDQALNVMLDPQNPENLNNPNLLKLSLETFDRNFEQGMNSEYKLVDLPLNPNLKYSKWDFDADLLEKADWRELFKYDPKFFETKEKIESEKIPWLEVPEEQRMVINYANWLCMSRKGKMMLEAYYNKILPNIKEVLAVQMTVNLLDEDGNDLNGVIDAVVRLQDGRVCVLDNKTTSSEYEEDSVRGSEQLAKYMAILNIKAEDPEDPWEHRVDCAAYAVMSKKLIKDITRTCASCGHIADSKAKTCDQELEVPGKLVKGKQATKRCGGEWIKDKKFEVQTQFIVDIISEEFQDSVIQNAVTVKSCIEMGLFPKNYGSCSNIYGSECQFINLCHAGKTDGLVKLEKKDK
jgi:PD-(D/E)XK nuclease superfamily protein